MNLVLLSIIGISIIFLCTTIGAACVFVFRNNNISPKINQILLGFASGVMLSASIFSLIIPAVENSDDNYMPMWLVAGLSVVLGAMFIWGIDKILPHLHSEGREEGIKTTKVSKNFKMFLAVTIHNIPEGLSVGIAYGIALASWNTNPQAAIMGALMLAIGIGIQNIPEGAVVSLMYKGATGSNKKSFLYGMLSGAVEPVAAVVGLFLAMQIKIIMPWALAFAAGCMLYVIAEEMIPDMKGNSIHHHGVWAFIIGFVVMMILDISLG